MKYDVFISYRRDGGDAAAYLIAEALRKRHQIVFFDVKKMNSGEFGEQIYDEIEKARVVVSILSENSLNRCIGNPKDWVRQEIEHSLECNKTIIPIMLRKFTFPENLPQTMVRIKDMHGIKVNMDYTFDASIDHLVELIKNSPGEAAGARDEIQVNMSSYKNFTSCVLEDTVFKIKCENKEISAYVNFETTCLRKEIPEYAGIYYLFTPAVDNSYRQKIVFDACSEDGSIKNFWLEIKPEGKKWMHESFKFELTKEYKTFSVNIQDFSNPLTAEQFEELTFLFKSTSFRDENQISGKIKIKDIRIK